MVYTARPQLLATAGKPTKQHTRQMTNTPSVYLPGVPGVLAVSRVLGMRGVFGVLGVPSAWRPYCAKRVPCVPGVLVCSVSQV